MTSEVTRPPAWRLEAAAEVAKKGKVAKHVRALIVPGLQQVAKAAEAEGLHEIFKAAGFEWRKAGARELAPYGGGRRSNSAGRRTGPRA